MAICEGSVVMSMTKIIGTVIGIDYSARTVLIKKENGGVCACPINSVAVVSYEEVE